MVTCGTSTATPHVSGLAALLFAQQPGRTVTDIRKIIEATADDDAMRPGRDEYFGAGRINVERALRYNDHTPTVSRLAIEIPPNLGGAARTTATATAEAASTILGAEWFVERLGAPGTGAPMDPVDGLFDESAEQLKATIQTTLHQPTGAYRVWVRARNATGWGPASTGALLIDRTAPDIEIDSDSR
jgi:subtilisin family serine protease